MATQGLYHKDGSYNVTSKSDVEGAADSPKITDADSAEATVIGLLKGILEQLQAINTNTAG